MKSNIGLAELASPTGLGRGGSARDLVFTTRMRRCGVGARTELSVVRHDLPFLWLRADCRINNAIIRLQDSNTVPAHMPTTLWRRGLSGNPAGRPRGSRNALSEEVICALLRDFRKHGEKAIAKVRRDQPGIYLKVLALLIPRQDKLEHTNTIKTMTDEELESAIAFLHEMMAAQAVGSAHLVEMKAEPAALPAPGGQSPEKLSSKRKPNLMIEVDTAIGPQERTPRKMRPPAGE